MASFFPRQSSVLATVLIVIIILLAVIIPTFVFVLPPSLVIKRIQTLWSAKDSDAIVNASGPVPSTPISKVGQNSTHVSDTNKPPSANSSITNTAQTSETNDPSAPSTSSCDAPQPRSFPLKPPEEQNIPQVLLDYIEFHKTGRACLLNPKCKQKPKILVATCPRKKLCLGLGDRMRGVVFSFITAVITKRVYFLHDLSSPYPLEVGSAPSVIDWTLPPTIQVNDSWPYLEWYWCQRSVCDWNSPALTNLPNFNGEGPDINLFKDDVLKLFGDRPVVQLACRKVYHKGNGKFLERNPLLSNTYAELGRNVSQRRINIHRLLFQPSAGTRQMMKTLEYSSDYYSVHIRNGKDVGETHNDRFTYMSTHEEEAVDQILQCLGMLSEESKIRNVFLASDSATTKAMFLRKGKRKGFDVHVLEKQTLHFGKKRFLDGSTVWDSICESFLSVHTDLFMLAGGKVMIKTGSNFAGFAGYLTKEHHVMQHGRGNVSVESWCRLT